MNISEQHLKSAFVLDLLTNEESLRVLKQTASFQNFETTLGTIITKLHSFLQIPNLIFHNDIHQACIHFDRERLATSEKERDQFDNMLSENWSARNSIMLLLEKPAEYRQGLEQAYAPYRKVLRPPSKDASVVAYKNISKQLGHLKRGTSSETLKDYYSVRQDLLRSDLDLVIALQCRALGLKVPAQSAAQSNSLSR